jgi:hypothetical protein
MKVYVVLWYSADEAGLECVYATRELAEEYCRKFPQGAYSSLDVYEQEVLTDVPDKQVTSWYAQFA